MKKLALVLILFAPSLANASTLSASPLCPDGTVITGTTASDIVDLTQTAVIAAQGATKSVTLVSAMVTNSHATVGTVVKIQNGSTTVARGYAGPAGGGFVLAAPFVGAKNTAWNALAETTGSSLQVTYVGCVRVQLN